MPLLGGLIATLFGGLAAWLAAYVGKKAAVTVAFAAVVLAMTAALWVALLGLAAAVSWPSIPGLQIGLWLANADAFSGLVATVIGTEVTISAYRYNVEAARVAAVS